MYCAAMWGMNGLTDSHETARRLAVRCKNDEFLTVSRKKKVNGKLFFR